MYNFKSQHEIPLHLQTRGLNRPRLLPEDEEESALTVNGRKKHLGRNDFMRLAESLRLTEKQVFNTFDRFADNLEVVLQTLEKGFCSPNMKERYKMLLCKRAEHFGI